MTDANASLPFRVSVVLEELGTDLERSLQVVRSLGIRDVDFGSLWGRRVDRLTVAELVRARELFDQYGVQACVVGPETFKTVRLEGVPLEQLDDEPGLQDALALLRAQLQVAKLFGSGLSRVYSFRRSDMVSLGNPSARHPRGGPFPPEMQTKVVRALQLACREAERAEVTLALENVRSCWGDSGHNTGTILRQVDSPWLQVIWDPANGFVCGEEDVATGYEAVRPFVAHVHLKDAVLEDAESGLTRWERIGAGQVDLQGQLERLAADGYSGCVSVETHWAPEGGDNIGNTRATHASLVEMLGRVAVIQAPS